MRLCFTSLISVKLFGPIWDSGDFPFHVCVKDFNFFTMWFRSDLGSSFAHLGKLYSRVLSFSKQCHYKSFSGLFLISSVISFLLATGCAYTYMSYRFHPVVPRVYEVLEPANWLRECNVFEGSWVRDESYPLYNASECPFAEKGFNCLANGRKDRGYLKWRWKPKSCDIPKFSARDVLEKLRGKRVVFVGDSLSRTQWESFICLLMTGVDDKKSVYEVNGNKITKQIRFLGVRFRSYDIRVDFYRSVFIVQPGSVPRRAPKRVKATLKLDKLDDISNEWIDSDFLIFNTGHWWSATKLFDMGWYFQSSGSLKLGMPINYALGLALETWASWAETKINRNRTSVFFRTFESSHWSGRSRSSCKVTGRPSLKTNGRDRSPISDAIKKVVKKMAIPVKTLDVTYMGAFRSDGHVGKWSDNPSVPDCSHWCLPGVPDMWNEILISHIMSTDGELLR